jgi:hypothetical protein
MSRQIEELCGDPLFQLNMAIWRKGGRQKASPQLAEIVGQDKGSPVKWVPFPMFLHDLRGEAGDFLP